MIPVAIIDYGLCNLDSMARAVEKCGRAPVVTRDPADLAQADRLILPGVGAFGRAMANLREWGLAEEIHTQVVGEGIPILGVCLGMQLLAERSTEGAAATGLGLIDAAVERLDSTAARVPHVGWNVVDHHGAPLFDGIDPGLDFYFVHSYHVLPNRPQIAIASTPFADDRFVSAVSEGAVHGVQFHPEKSQRVGMRLLQNYLEL